VIGERARKKGKEKRKRKKVDDGELWSFESDERRDLDF
jgi:hypothetical protein